MQIRARGGEGGGGDMIYIIALILGLLIGFAIFEFRQRRKWNKYLEKWHENL